jgi:hypothetical protein
MPEVPVGVVPGPAEPALPQVHPAVAAREARAAKLAKVSAGLAKASTDAPIAPAPKAGTEKLPSEKLAEAVVEAKIEEKPVDEPTIEEKKSEPVVEAKEPADDELDAKTKKGLEAVDKQAKKFREEQARIRADFDIERAEHARRVAEFNAKASSFEELQKLAERDTLAAIRKLRPNLTEDDWEAIGRGAFPHTKAGKADPRSAAVAAQSAKDREYAERMERLEKQNQELLEKHETAQKQAEARKVVAEWQDSAVKAIPTDKPSIAAKRYASAPEKVRQELLAIAVQLEKANDGETPTHAEVVAAFEKRERAELEERGIDVDALLKGAPAAPKKPAAKTLDVGAPAGGTRPAVPAQTREQRLAATTAGLKKLNSAADADA